MEVYLDNSATTKCSENVIDIVKKTMAEDYGNPSSLHRKGMEAERYLREARERISRTLKVQEKDIIFTSGGTESNNMAIIGTALANRRKGQHVITTAIEHPSVKQAFVYLEEQGFEVTYLSVDSSGLIRLKELEEAVREDTILVSIMHVNNEIGTIEPVEEAAAVVKKNHADVVMHVDAIQSFGKLQLTPARNGIDLVSVSGHKIHGPKGIGFLYANRNVKLKPMILGGGQQQGRRSGTENVPGIAGLGQAAMDACARLEEKQEQMYALRTYFIERLLAFEHVTINGFADRRNAPHIVSANFDGVRSEVLLHALEDKGIYASSGSACASNKKTKGSDTLSAIGLGKKLEEGTIRFSFCTETSKEQLDICLKALEELLPVLRRYKHY